MRRVLISHSWDHPEQQRRLAELLVQHGYEYYDHSITVDAPIPTATTPELARELAARIGRVSAVVLMATEDVHKKPTVKFEIEEALRQGKRLVAVKPWGDATGPVPKLIDEYAHAIIGFRGEQIIAAIEGADIRNLSEYLISEREDFKCLANWVVRGVAGAVIIGSITAHHWLPALNRAIEDLNVKVVWTSNPPTGSDLLKNGLLGAGLGAGLGALLTALTGDKRLFWTLAASGAAVGVGGTLTKALSLKTVDRGPEVVACYSPIGSGW